MRRRFNTLFAAVALTLCAAQTFASVSEVQPIAVYVSGSVSSDAMTVVQSRMLRRFIDTGRYRGIERSAAFLAELEREQEKQMSGAVNDEQIVQLGRMFGLKHIVIAVMTQVLGEIQLSARIVDVETAQILVITESTRKVENMRQLNGLADRVVRSLLRRQNRDEARAAAIARAAEEARLAEEAQAQQNAFAAGGIEQHVIIVNDPVAPAAQNVTPTTEASSNITEDVSMTSAAQDDGSLDLSMSDFDRLRDELSDGGAQDENQSARFSLSSLSEHLTTHSRTLRISGAVAGAGGFLTGIIFNAASNSSYKEYETAATSQEARDARRSTENAMTARNIFYTLGFVGLAALSVTFIF